MTTTVVLNPTTVSETMINSQAKTITMNTKHISLAFAAAAALLAGCAKGTIEGPVDGRLANLELSYVGATETKAAIDGTTFPTDGKIGLFLFADETADTPYGDGYANVEYSYNSTKGKWTASPSIKVGSTPGYLYGYYPYSSTAADVKSIHVASSLIGDDVMYATSQTVTDKTASQTKITMNHALARVAVTVVNKGYTGVAKLSSIKFAGAETSASGTLNAINGNITAIKSDVTLDVPAACQDITATGTTYDCLLVPSKDETGRQDVNLTLTIDGQEKTASLSSNNGVIIAQNTKSNITITLSNSGISVQTVSVEDWNVIEIGGHKFTLKLSAEDAGIADNLIVQCKPDGNSVKVEVYSKEVKPLVIRIGTGTRVAPVENGNISTFTISDITSDITATLAYAKTFKVTGRIVPDVTPTGSYLDNMIKFEGLGDYIEGRFTSVTVKINGTAPGYKYTKMVCDSRTVTGDTIVLEDITKDLEVSALYEFYDYPLPGVFTVDDNGRKVKFARGNMWCQNQVLHNEDEQYQFSSDKRMYSGHISHFMWCKSLTESLELQYIEYGTTSNDTFFTNAEDNQLSPNPGLIVNGQKGIWRVLSGGDEGEWDYLLNSRATTYGSGELSTDNHRYAAVKVNDMAGLLIFPDEFSWPTGAGTEPATFNSAESDWNGVNYIGTAFETLQSAGCVFLPAAGFRNGDPHYQYSEDLHDVGSIGYYWSASTTFEVTAIGLYFDSSLVIPDNSDFRYHAYSVRLVTDVME